MGHTKATKCVAVCVCASCVGMCVNMCVKVREKYTALSHVDKQIVKHDLFAHWLHMNLL